MELTWLGFENFRNLSTTRIETDSRFVIFVGDNAQGKTNALEAVYSLANLRPLNSSKSSELIQFEADKMRLAGGVRLGGITRVHKFELCPPKRRVVTVDKLRVTSLVEYFRGFRAIAFTPQNLEIVAGAPLIRRAWLDRAAFTVNPGHLNIVRTYGKLLKQKSALLRERRIDQLLLDSLNEQLAVAGAALIHGRVQTLSSLNDHISSMYQTISNGMENIKVDYKSELYSDRPKNIIEELMKQFSENRIAELASRRTLVGPHRDDVTLLVNDRSLRNFGSRGQVRTAVLACKLAELKSASLLGVTPPFLYDDVGSELDATRMDRLISVLQELDTQVFFTTTNLDHLACLPKKQGLTYRLNNGVFSH